MRTGRLSISRGHQLQGTPEQPAPPQLTLVPQPRRARAPPASPDYHARPRPADLARAADPAVRAWRAFGRGVRRRKGADPRPPRRRAGAARDGAGPLRPGRAAPAAARAVADRADAELEVPAVQPRRRPRLLLRDPAERDGALLRSDPAPVRRLSAIFPLAFKRLLGRSRAHDPLSRAAPPRRAAAAAATAAGRSVRAPAAALPIASFHSAPGPLRRCRAGSGAAPSRRCRSRCGSPSRATDPLPLPDRPEGTAARASARSARPRDPPARCSRSGAGADRVALRARRAGAGLRGRLRGPARQRRAADEALLYRYAALGAHANPGAAAALWSARFRPAATAGVDLRVPTRCRVSRSTSSPCDPGGSGRDFLQLLQLRRGCAGAAGPHPAAELERQSRARHAAAISSSAGRASRRSRAPAASIISSATAPRARRPRRAPPVSDFRPRTRALRRRRAAPGRARASGCNIRSSSPGARPTAG